MVVHGANRTAIYWRGQRRRLERIPRGVHKFCEGDRRGGAGYGEICQYRRTNATVFSNDIDSRQRFAAGS